MHHLGQRHHHQKIVLERAAFALDVALCLYRRITHLAGVVRWLVTDSSPGKQHDWLWARAKELDRSEFIATCQAASELTLSVRAYARGLERQLHHANPHERQALVYAPKQTWSAWLKQLLNLREHI